MASAYEKHPGKFYARWKNANGAWQDTPTNADETEAKSRNRLAVDLQKVGTPAG